MPGSAGRPGAGNQHLAHAESFEGAAAHDAERDFLGQGHPHRSGQPQRGMVPPVEPTRSSLPRRRSDGGMDMAAQRPMKSTPASGGPAGPAARNCRSQFAEEMSLGLVA